MFDRARNISNKKIEPNADISPTVRADAPDGDQDEGSIGSTKEDNDVLDQIIKRHEEEEGDLINERRANNLPPEEDVNDPEIQRSMPTFRR